MSWRWLRARSIAPCSSIPASRRPGSPGAFWSTSSAVRRRRCGPTSAPWRCDLVSRTRNHCSRSNSRYRETRKRRSRAFARLCVSIRSPPRPGPTWPPAVFQWVKTMQRSQPQKGHSNSPPIGPMSVSCSEWFSSTPATTRLPRASSRGSRCPGPAPGRKRSWRGHWSALAALMQRVP